jgi:hypothetical protein
MLDDEVMKMTTRKRRHELALGNSTDCLTRVTDDGESILVGNQQHSRGSG